MNTGHTLFAQLLSVIPFSHFEHLVDKYQANRWTRNFTAWSFCSPAIVWCSLPLARRTCLGLRDATSALMEIERLIVAAEERGAN